MTTQSTSNELLSPEYKAQLIEMHKASPWGGAGASWIPEIVKLMIQFKLRVEYSSDKTEVFSAPAILDYGCGRRTFSQTMSWLMPHVMVSDYDPGIEKCDAVRTGPFDLVLCTDVMEHVEERFIHETFKRILGLTKHAAFFNIALTPAKSRLPDGRNAHLTVRNADWWENEVMRVFPHIELLAQHKGFTFVAYPT